MNSRFVWCVGRLIDELEGTATTNDPDDPGGLTKYGISARAHPGVDVANLTRLDAEAIYKRDYWDAVRADTLPQPLDAYVFDAAVNQGVAAAAHWLQEVLHVPADGVIGPMTIGAAWRAPRAETAALFLAQRALHYVSLETFTKYGRGWLKRLFIVAAAQQT